MHHADGAAKNGKLTTVLDWSGRAVTDKEVAISLVGAQKIFPAIACCAPWRCAILGLPTEAASDTCLGQFPCPLIAAKRRRNIGEKNIVLCDKVNTVRGEAPRPLAADHDVERYW